MLPFLALDLGVVIDLLLLLLLIVLQPLDLIPNP